MRKTTLIKRLLLVSLLALLLSGCGTSRSALIVKDDPMKIIERGGITIALRFLDEDTLKVKYGPANNPFLTYYTSLQLNRIMVFELSVKAADAPVLLSLSRMELQFGNRIAKPIDAFGLSEYWKSRDQYSQDKNPDTAKKELLARRELLPYETRIEPQTRLNKLVVFMENLPQYGKCTVYLPLFSESKQPLDTLQFDFQF